MFKNYYELAKPERTLTNVLTAAAGYLFASKWHIHWGVFLALLVGSTLIIASACVFNNYLDRRLDSHMKRTKKRALVLHEVSGKAAITYGSILGLMGFITLTRTNWLTFTVGVIAFVSYVFVYGWAKRHTIYSTLIGTIPGGASLVAGYTAFTNHLDTAALLLFIAMVSWQMAHFYAIGIYRLEDYRSAGLPIWPVKKGVASTKQQIIFFIIAFILASVLLTYLGHAGLIFAFVMLLVGIEWLRKALVTPKRQDEAMWGRSVFLFSLKVIMVFSVMVAVGPILP